MEVTNKYVIIKSQVDGAPKESDFELQTEKLELSVEAGSKNIIVKNIYVSIDPYQLNRMKSQSSSQKTSSFAVGIKPGEAIDTYGVGRVVASENAEFEKGDLVELLKTTLGFDDAFNYKEETDLKSTLKRYFPEGIDIYFDNVGGAMLEVAVANMNIFGRVAVCGVISEYTDAGKRAAPDMLDVVYKRITIRGFLAGDLINLFGEFISSTVDYLRSGEMKVIEDISKGVETVPSAFVGLFRGDNVGKKIVQIADE
ncbi:Oxidoreductase, N-terminal domain [Dillenia turbinata]|uniref:Oxidoreductase, N-terminal domain n=1 Tax=Dillenia turbinata TaxID=194707 RepID=A0AAN8VXJ3_9MAGN